jgi:branched-chain amino acid transport system substrate-binding protein
MMHHRVLSHARSALLAGLIAVALASAAHAQKKYDQGATDTEIKIGNIMPYSGPLSAYALIGRTQDAFFRKLNAEGGISGRKINFISYDDSFSPAKTVEQARKLVESDEVLLIFQSLGTPTNNAIQKYLNEKKVPQLFVATGATKFGDPKNFPWTMGWQPTYQTEGRIYARYILEKLPQAKLGILYQNDDSGRDYLKGLKDGLGAEATKRMIVGELPYEPADPTVDRQIVTPENTWRRRLFQRSLAEIRRAGDPEGGRDRLEAGPVPCQPLEFRGLRAQARRAQERQGNPVDQLSQGPHRPDLERRSRDQGVGRLHG